MRTKTNGTCRNIIYNIGNNTHCNICATVTRSVKKAGQQIELTSVEFTLLEVLLRQAGEVISREDLVEKALGRRLSAYDRSIDVHVSALRKKLGHHYGNVERIKTIRGVGYLYALPEGCRTA